MAASNVVAPDFSKAAKDGGDRMPAQPVEVQGFEEFWKWCLKRVGKPLAMAKFKAITSEKGLLTRTLDRDSNAYVEIYLKAMPAELIEGMKRYTFEQCPTATFTEIATGKVKLPDGGRFICHPATWLNQGRWMT